MSASTIARPLLPIRSEITRVQFDVGVFERLMYAQNATRLLTHQLLVRAQQSAKLVRRGVRHKAGTDETMRQRSANHSLSLTSVLRPGTFLTCAAFANTNWNSPSAKMCHTGFQ